PPTLSRHFLRLCPLFCLHTTTAPSDIYTLSLHDALPISYPKWNENCPITKRPPKACSRNCGHSCCGKFIGSTTCICSRTGKCWTDRKSTRLNSSHVKISYAVFCLKKKA